MAELLLGVGEDGCEGSLFVDGVHSEYLYGEAKLFSVEDVVLFVEGELDFWVLAFHVVNKIKCIKI